MPGRKVGSKLLKICPFFAGQFDRPMPLSVLVRVARLSATVFAYALSSFLLPETKADDVRVQLGTTEIILPNPQGYVALNLDDKNVSTAIAQAWPVPSTNKRLGMLFRKEDVEAPDFDLDGRPIKTIDFQTIQALQTTETPLTYFNGEKELLKSAHAEKNKYVEEGLEQRKELIKKMDFGPNAVAESKSLPVFFESEKAFAYTILWKITTTGEDKVPKVVEHAVTLCSILIKGKIILIYIRGSKADAKWTQDEARDFATGLIARNAEK